MLGINRPYQERLVTHPNGNKCCIGRELETLFDAASRFVVGLDTRETEHRSDREPAALEQAERKKGRVGPLTRLQESKGILRAQDEPGGLELSDRAAHHESPYISRDPDSVRQLVS